MTKPPEVPPHYVSYPRPWLMPPITDNPGRLEALGSAYDGILKCDTYAITSALLAVVAYAIAPLFLMVVPAILYCLTILYALSHTALMMRAMNRQFKTALADAVLVAVIPLIGTMIVQWILMRELRKLGYRDIVYNPVKFKHSSRKGDASKLNPKRNPSRRRLCET